MRAPSRPIGVPWAFFSLRLTGVGRILGPTYGRADPVGHAVSGHPRACARPPTWGVRMLTTRQYSFTSYSAADDLRIMSGRISERTRRLSTLLELDRALSAAANRYDLAAEIVRHGWPHRAD